MLALSLSPKPDTHAESTSIGTNNIAQYPPLLPTAPYFVNQTQYTPTERAITVPNLNIAQKASTPLLTLALYFGTQLCDATIKQTFVIDHTALIQLSPSPKPAPLRNHQQWHWYQTPRASFSTTVPSGIIQL